MNNERGLTIIMAVLLMLVLVTLGQGMLFIARQEKTNILSLKLTQTAFYLAEAGIEQAVARLRFWEDYPGEGWVPLGRGGFSMKVEEQKKPGEYAIHSTGYLPHPRDPVARRDIEATVRVHYEEPEIFSYAVSAKKKGTLRGGFQTNSSPEENQGGVYAGEMLELGDRVEVHGPVLAGGKIQIAPTAVVFSDVCAGGEIEGGGQIYGERRIPCEKTGLTFPQITEHEFRTIALLGGVVSSREWSHPISTGPLFVDGNLKLSKGGDLQIRGVIFVNGSFHASGPSTLRGRGILYAVRSIEIGEGVEVGEAEQGPILIAAYWNPLGIGMRVEEKAKLRSAVFFAPHSGIELAGEGKVYGLISGEWVNLSGAQVIRLTDSVRPLPGADPSVEVVEWNEIR